MIIAEDKEECCWCDQVMGGEGAVTISLAQKNKPYPPSLF